MSRDIALNLIDPDPDQPRQHFDQAGIEELAQSMEAKGLIVPIMVRPDGDRYVIVHGERRWRAALSLEWKAIPAEVRDVSPEEARWLSLIENVQRQDLSPVEEARAYQERLAEGITQEELGQRVGKSRTYIAQKLRLLTLPDPLVFYLDKKAISEGHARQLLRLKKMYGDLQVNWEPPSDWAEKLPEISAWCRLVFPLLRDIRPEDNPICWFFEVTDDGRAPMGDPTWQTLAEGCKLFVQYVAANNCKVSQWAVAAFWWACCAIYADLSVAQLSKQLTNWEERFLTAIAFAYSRGYPESKRAATDLQKLRLTRQWGYLSDVRHSNALDWVRFFKDDGNITLGAKEQRLALELISKALLRVCQPNYSPCEPSCLQPWGFQHERYKEAMKDDLYRGEDF